MTNTAGTKLREDVFKWLIGILGTIGVTVMGMIYTELKESNKQMTEMMVSMTEHKKDIQYLNNWKVEQGEKDKQQDQRISAHDELLFIKPEEVRVKFNQR